MIRTYKFADYRDAIAALPIRENSDPWYQRNELITDRFLLFTDGPLAAYYAPFHDMNLKARVAIVGLTPGWTQMERAFRTARQGLAEGVEDEALFRLITRASDFAGYMRKMLVKWFDEIALNTRLEILSCAALFGSSIELVHTTSAVSAAIFKDGKNYTGYNPSLLTLPKFQTFIAENFAKELALLPEAVIVPLGKIAGEIVQFLHDENHVTLNRCLVGFPHPSGSNGHRFREFAEGRDEWREKLQAWLA
jgi:hypothetical protein